jgi:hypothetical protein
VGAGDQAHPERTLDTIGDIAVTQNTAITPAGHFPIRGSVWTTTDMSRTEKSTPVWAIIVAILNLWWTGLLSLLTLLAKETKTTGHIQVAVQSNGHHHTTQIMTRDRAHAMHVNQQVNYARSLAA